jgi:putative transcriptional regulator
MEDKLILKNRLKEVRAQNKLSQSQLAEMVGVSRNTISSIETGQFNPTAKLALIFVLLWTKNLKNCFSLISRIFFGKIMSIIYRYTNSKRILRIGLSGY